MKAKLSRWCIAAALSLLPVLASAQSTMKATVSFLAGKAVALDSKGVVRDLKSGDSIHEGEKIRLETKKSRVVLKVSDGTELRLKGRTQIGFTQFNRSASGQTRKTKLELAWGHIWAKVAKLTNKSSRFEVKAGGVICGVRGTTLAGEFNPDHKEGTFWNIEGHVYVDDGNGPQDVPEGTGTDFASDVLGGNHPGDPGDGGGGFSFNAGGGSSGGGGGDGGGGGGQGGSSDAQDNLGDGTDQNGNTGRETIDGATGGNPGAGLGFTIPEGWGGGR